uniref:Uncharacterized protein n=1 Tax=Ditylum brightwellii TaxID=49249 RepID=A0A7S2A1F0_9STRA
MINNKQTLQPKNKMTKNIFAAHTRLQRNLYKMNTIQEHSHDCSFLSRLLLSTFTFMGTIVLAILTIATMIMATVFIATTLVGMIFMVSMAATTENKPIVAAAVIDPSSLAAAEMTNTVPMALAAAATQLRPLENSSEQPYVGVNGSNISGIAANTVPIALAAAIVNGSNATNTFQICNETN